MEIGGIALVTAIVLILVTIPQVIERRRAILESREGDRFSADLRLLDPFAAKPAPREHRGSCRLISEKSIIHRISAEEMIQGGSVSTSARRPLQGAGAKARAHELAQLRARRAARRSAEAAAGQRRMAVAGVFAGLIFVALVLAGISENVTWLSVLAPVSGLLATLVLSRRAAIRNEAADAADRARIEKLMGRARPRTTDRVSATVAEEPAAAASSIEDAARGLPEATEARVDAVQGSDAVPSPAAVASTSVEVAVAASMSHPDSRTVEAHETTSVVQAPSSVQDVEDTSRKWVPGVLPVSRYSQGSRAVGKVVHADTDLRGIPRVNAAVPARPIAATRDPEARSTEEVAASVPLAFDLDGVLEARRA